MEIAACGPRPPTSLSNRTEALCSLHHPPASCAREALASSRGSEQMAPRRTTAMRLWRPPRGGIYTAGGGAGICPAPLHGAALHE